MKKYTCILFDLDHTLWDYDANSEETLQELFDRHKLSDRGVTSFRYFFETFQRVNLQLWDLYDRGLIGQEVIRSERFHRVLFETGVDDRRFSLEFSAHYLHELPTRNKLIPGARDLLEYLHPKYPMTIITNGFDEIQSRKMNSAGIGHFFRHVVTSQRAGSKKPSPKIFEFALRESGKQPAEAIMIGDNLQTDIVGAETAGIDAVYYNPSQKLHGSKVTHEVSVLQELQAFL